MDNAAVERPVSPAIEHTVSPFSILRFFIPLSLAYMCYAVVFNVMNRSMASSKDAAVALAAFAIGQSIADLVSMPANSGSQWLLAGGRDKRSFKLGLKVMLQIAVTVSVLLALIAATPIGEFIYGRIFNAPKELHPGIRSMLFLCIPLPLILVIRGASQAVIMLQRKTHLMTAVVVIRLVYIALFSSWAVGRLDGTLLGGILWVSGMGLESACNCVIASRLFRFHPDESADGREPTVPQIWRFLLPLIATGFFWSLGNPVLNAGMARTTHPKQAIAVYQLVNNAAWLLLAFARDGYRQVVMVFWNDRRSLQVVQSFAKALALTTSAVMVLATLSGAALWFLRNVVCAPEELLIPARNVLLLVSLQPAFLVAIELYVGKLMRAGNTAPIGLAKGACVVAMVVTVSVMAKLVPSAGPLLGATAVLTSSLVEIAVLYPAAKRLSPDLLEQLAVRE